MRSCAAAESASKESSTNVRRDEHVLDAQTARCLRLDENASIVQSPTTACASLPDDDDEVDNDDDSSRTSAHARSASAKFVR